MFLLCLVASVNGNSTFIIQTFENNPIAYVEKIGESQIVNGDWNLLVYYDLINYFNEFNLIRAEVARVEQKCNEVGLDCEALATQFKLRIRGIQEKNEILMNDPGEIRAKRELMTLLGIGLGGLAVGGGALYAWLSKSEAENYAEAIENLKINQNQMMELIEKQTSVIEISYDLDKQNAETSEKEKKSWRNLIDALAREERDGWHLHNIALQCLIKLENYADIQNRIIDAAMTVHNGNLRPVLISPSKMHEQVNSIRNYLGPEFELPKTITHIYQMASVKVRLVENKLIFRVSIPVLRASPFQIWQIIPIPRTSNEISVEIRLTTEYLLVNDNNETYYDLTNIEYNACNEIDDRLICRARHPLYKFGDVTARCEIELIRNVTSNHTSCRTQAVALIERWSQLNDIHSWIFVLDGEKSYIVSCKEFSKTITLTGVGLIYLNGNCSLAGETMRISTNQLETKITTGYFVSANVSMTFVHPQIMHNMSLARINTTVLDAAIQDLKKNAAKKPFDISIHDWHQYSVIYGMILVAIILCGIRQQMKSKNGEPNQIIFK